MLIDDIDKAIVHLLRHNSAVVNVVGPRIYCGWLPQKAPLPALTYVEVGTDPFHDLDNAAGVTLDTYQFDVWAETYDQARSLREAVRNAFQGLGPVTVGMIRLHSVVRRNSTYLPERPADASDRLTHRFSLDFDFLWGESIPQRTA